MKAFLSLSFTSVLVAFVGHPLFAQAVVADATATQEFVTYHPLIVHFPIVLLIVAAVLALANLVLKKPDYETLTVVLAVAGAAGAFIASSIHPHVIREADPVIRDIFRAHDKWADLTELTSIIAAVIWLVARFVFRKPIVKYLGTAALVAAAIFVSLSGHEGAKLVHQYDVGPQGHMLHLEPGSVK